MAARFPGRLERSRPCTGDCGSGRSPTEIEPAHASASQRVSALGPLKGLVRLEQHGLAGPDEGADATKRRERLADEILDGLDAQVALIGARDRDDGTGGLGECLADRGADPVRANRRGLLAGFAGSRDGLVGLRVECPDPGEHLGFVFAVRRVGIGQGRLQDRLGYPEPVIASTSK